MQSESRTPAPTATDGPCPDRLPRMVRKELAKLGREDSLMALAAVAQAHSAGRQENAFLSFGDAKTARKERRRAKRVLAEHLPFLRLRKCVESGSECLHVCSRPPAASAGESAGVRVIESSATDEEQRMSKKKRRRLEKARAKADHAQGCSIGEGPDYAKALNKTNSKDIGPMQQRHLKYMQNLAKRLGHIDALLKREADGKRLTEQEEVTAKKRACVFKELTAAVGKTKSGELGNWKGIRLDFLDNVPADVRRVSPNYLDMLACKDELDALRRAGKLRRKPTHDPAFADIRKNDTALWCGPGEDPSAVALRSVWAWRDDGSGPVSLTDLADGPASSASGEKRRAARRTQRDAEVGGGHEVAGGQDNGLVGDSAEPVRKKRKKANTHAESSKRDEQKKAAKKRTGSR